MQLVKKHFHLYNHFFFNPLTSDFLSSFCITICLALLPEMLMCSWSLSISCPVPSWSISSFSSFLSCRLEAPAWLDRTGGDESTGFTRPTWGSTGMGGRTGVTPFRVKADMQSVTPMVIIHTKTKKGNCLTAVWTDHHQHSCQLRLSNYTVINYIEAGQNKLVDKIMWTKQSGALYLTLHHRNDWGGLEKL